MKYVTTDYYKPANPSLYKGILYLHININDNTKPKLQRQIIISFCFFVINLKSRYYTLYTYVFMCWRHNFVNCYNIIKKSSS